MKHILPIVIVVVTAILIALAQAGAGGPAKTFGIVSGSALPGFAPKAASPEQAVANLLIDGQRRNWDRAYSVLAQTANRADAPWFTRAWAGTDGALHTVSTLKGADGGTRQTTSDHAW